MKFIDSGFVDGYSNKHSDEHGKFAWWSNKLNKRLENKGWRLDYCPVSEKLREKISDCDMMTEQMGSDHCPVVMDIGLTDFMEQRIETKRPRKVVLY